jgi:hypothetical protein
MEHRSCGLLLFQSAATFSSGARLYRIVTNSMKTEAGFTLHTIRRAALAALASIELLVLLAALTKPAWGYVDPGSGLLAVQVGGSMLAGGLFILRSKIRKLFGLSTPRKDNDEAETSTTSEAEE